MPQELTPPADSMPARRKTASVQACQPAATSCAGQDLLEQAQPGTTCRIETDAQEARPVAACWACHCTVQVPLVDGAPAPVYMCGWCGALTQSEAAASACTPGAPGRSTPGARCRGLLLAWLPLPQQLLQTRPVRAALWLVRWGAVALVLALIASAVVVGVIFLLRPLCQGSAAAAIGHGMLTAVLVANILAHYVLAVLQPAGSPRQHAADFVPASLPVPRGCFNGFTYCRRCAYFKPPHAHHCRVCGTCVVDMDHHCPFINNCVGGSRGNLRPFLLLLAWLLAGCAYCLALSAALAWRRRAEVWNFIMAAQHEVGRSGWRATGPLAVLLVVRAPAPAVATLYLGSLSAGSAIGLGLLFGSQLRYALRGESYIDSLKRATGQADAHTLQGGDSDGDARAARRRAWDNARRIFGPGHLATWPWPRLGAGRLLLQLAKKGS